MLTIRDFQTQHGAWVKRNFGDRPAYWPLLGIGEELGELSHAQLKMDQGIRGTREEHLKKQRDAIGDITIFASDYCAAMKWDLMSILDECKTFARFEDDCCNSPLLRDYATILKARWHAGQIDYAYLSEIPPSFDFSEEVNKSMITKGKSNMRSLFVMLVNYCKIRGWSLQQIVEETWAKVSQRDWKKDAKTGGDLDAQADSGMKT